MCREFFYIQIEKFVRQQKATGLKKADDIRLSREHELIRSMETHFNKGDEIEVSFKIVLLFCNLKYNMILTANAILYYRL